MTRAHQTAISGGLQQFADQCLVPDAPFRRCVISALSSRIIRASSGFLQDEQLYFVTRSANAVSRERRSLSISSIIPIGSDIKVT